MEKMGYNVMIITLYRSGGTHAITKFTLDNESIIVDPSDKTGFNESPKNEMYPIKKIFYVEGSYFNGTTIDLTSEYAGISSVNVSLRFKIGSRPIKNGDIIFSSEGLRFILKTNENGMVEGVLGGNNTYSVSYGLLYAPENIYFPYGGKFQREITFGVDVKIWLIIGGLIIIAIVSFTLNKVRTKPH